MIICKRIIKLFYFRRSNVSISVLSVVLVAYTLSVFSYNSVTSQSMIVHRQFGYVCYETKHICCAVHGHCSPIRLLTILLLSPSFFMVFIKKKNRQFQPFIRGAATRTHVGGLERNR